MDIITDQSALRQISDPVIITNNKIGVKDSDFLNSFIETFQESKGIGLSAPQVGVFRRIIIAKLKLNDVRTEPLVMIFVNPRWEPTKDLQVASTEGCLSLPGIQSCVERYKTIRVFADKFYRYLEGEGIEDCVKLESLNCQDRDAFVIQHECDHLDGRLMVDLPPTKNKQDILEQKFRDRQERIAKNRLQKKQKAIAKQLKLTKKHKKKVSAEKLKKLKRRQKKEAKRRQMRVEMQERIKMEAEGFFDNSPGLGSPPISN